MFWFCTFCQISRQYELPSRQEQGITGCIYQLFTGIEQNTFIQPCCNFVSVCDPAGWRNCLPGRSIVYYFERKNTPGKIWHSNQCELFNGLPAHATYIRNQSC